MALKKWIAQYFHVTLHEVSIEPHVPNKNSKMEVLPAELHPHVDAIDIEEGSS